MREGGAGAHDCEPGARDAALKDRGTRAVIEKAEDYDSESDPDCDEDTRIRKRIARRMDARKKTAKYDAATGARTFDVDIGQIKVYSDVAGGVKRSWFAKAKADHADKLETFRRAKGYQTWLNDDEEDVEAEKVYHDINSLFKEKMFNVYFQDDMDVDFGHEPAPVRTERERGESDADYEKKYQKQLEAGMRKAGLPTRARGDYMAEQDLPGLDVGDIFRKTGLRR